MLSRRDFIKMSAYMAMALKTGFVSQAMATEKAFIPPTASLKGHIVAATLNPHTKGVFPRDKYETTLASLDLETGYFNLVPMKIKGVHDAVKVKDNYLVLPNFKNSPMRFSNLEGAGKDIHLGGDTQITGHGYFDEEKNIVIVCTNDRANENKAKFAIIDPDDHRLIDFVEADGYNPHDIKLLDKDTLAVCNYNTKYYLKPDQAGYKFKLRDGYSYLSLYDRKTLKLKKNITAYKNALITHTSVTNNGDLYAIGSMEYFDPDIEKWQAEYIEDKFESFFSENHPELSEQWPDIAHSLKIQRIERAEKGFNLPFLPLQMPNGSSDLNVLPVENFHHRGAQSICYVRETNTICMSFPHSDSILLYNATTNETHHVSGDQLNLKEMRGISEVEGTPYLAISGVRRGITIVDTKTQKNIKHYDVRLGRIIHMNHVL